MATTKAVHDRMRGLVRELAGWKGQVINARSESERKAAQDRVNALEADLKRAAEGKIVASH
jgi:predicted RNase H-like nuclease